MFNHYKDLFDFKGKNVVVTGGAGLLGKEIVKCFAVFGAHTIIADTDRAESKKRFFLFHFGAFLPYQIFRESIVSLFQMSTAAFCPK